MGPAKDKHGVRESFAKVIFLFAKNGRSGIKEFWSTTIYCGRFHVVRERSKIKDIWNMCVQIGEKSVLVSISSSHEHRHVSCQALCLAWGLPMCLPFLLRMFGISYHKDTRIPISYPFLPDFFCSHKSDTQQQELRQHLFFYGNRSLFWLSRSTTKIKKHWWSAKTVSLGKMNALISTHI